MNCSSAPRRPSNLVIEVNGHEIYRHGGRFHLWTDGIGWWAFDICSEEEARKTCAAVSAPPKPGYPAAVRQAFAVLGQCQASAQASSPKRGTPWAAWRRSQAARKAAVTRASKAFSRACFAAGFSDPQAVCDALTLEEQRAQAARG